MKKYIPIMLLLFLTTGFSTSLFSQTSRKDYSLQVDSILNLMTLEEKSGADDSVF